MLTDMEAESYVGIPLWSTKGEAIGLIAISNTKPIENATEIETILQIVSGRISFEIERRLMDEELKANEKKLQNIFDVANAGVSITDKSGRYIMFNEWWVKNTGYDNDELLEMTNIGITHPDDKETSIKWFSQILEGKVDEYRIEKRFVRKDQSIFGVIFPFQQSGIITMTLLML